MEVSIVLVSPELAADWLVEHNKNNRPMKLSSVQTLADLMTKNLYKENGESIIFSNTGRLLDGQHRLQAIVNSGRTYEFVVVRGIPDPYFDTIDIGKPRTVADILGIIGNKSGNEIAAIARIAMLFENGKAIGGSGRNVLSPKEVAEYIYNNKYLLDVAEQVRKSRGPLTSSPLGAVIYLGNNTRQYDKDVEKFLEEIKTGEGLKSGNPVLALREWTIKEKAKAHTIIPKEVAFEIVAKAWSMWMENKNLSVIKPRAILGRPVEIFGFTGFREGDRVSLRTRPSREVPNGSVALPSAP